MRTSVLSKFAMCAALFCCIAMTCSSASATVAELSGAVLSGATPQAHVRVTLNEATEGEPIVLARTRTDGLGLFSFESPADQSDSVFFVTAELGLGVRFVTILGPTLPFETVVNELTTVAASYSMAQFYREGWISGNAFGLRIAAGMNDNLVTPETGRSSPVLLNPPNADQTHSLRMTRSLSNLVRLCVDNVSARLLFFYLTTPADGTMPWSTDVALANLARDPGQHASLLYLMSQFDESYAPALQCQPDAWSVTVKVNDSGDDNVLFGGPANVAFDSRGYAWVANNTVQGTPNSSRYIMVLQPNGRPAVGGPGLPTSPVMGGGILGVGWGITVHQDRVWIGNFGWGDPDQDWPTEHPTGDPNDPGNGSVSSLSLTGLPLSPPDGFYGGTWRVQGIKADQDGNIWTSSFYNDSVRVFPGGNPDLAIGAYIHPNAAPFGLAIDPRGDAWVSNSGGLSGANQSSVAKFVLQNNGRVKEKYLINVGDTLKVIDTDSKGNAWVASQGDSTIYGFRHNGKPIGGFRGGGVDGPWGLTVDGEDNIWVANFGPLKFDSNFTTGGISKLAGINPPPGKQTGDPLSPATGYTVHSAGSPVTLHDGTPLYGEGGRPSFTPLMRQTGVSIDQAGNIWSINNWKPLFLTDVAGFDDGRISPDDANPGGDGIIIFVGLAPPPRM